MKCNICNERISKHPVIVKRWVHLNRDLDANHKAAPDINIYIRGVRV